MRLGDWLALKKIKREECASDLSVDTATVGRWVRGESVPQPAKMVRIVAYTQGQVTANDFMVQPEGECTVNADPEGSSTVPVEGRAA